MADTLTQILVDTTHIQRDTLTHIPCDTLHKWLKAQPQGFARNAQNQLSLDLLVIDEMSMVSSDLFYKVDAKLKEVFHLKREIPFTGIGILLVGDLLQIPPVKAGYIFSRPKNEKSGIAHDIVDHESRFLFNNLKVQLTLMIFFQIILKYLHYGYLILMEGVHNMHLMNTSLKAQLEMH